MAGLRAGKSSKGPRRRRKGDFMSNDWDARALSFLEAGDDLGALSKAPAPSWSEEESAACRARVKAALRLRRMDLLDRALDDFGGAPLGAGRLGERGEVKAGDLAWEAAADPQAFGFAKIVAGQKATFLETLAAERQALEESGQAPMSDEDWAALEKKKVGEWLRGGASGAASRGPSAPWFAAQAASAHSQPVAACFARDNARALACLLADRENFELLVLDEPKKPRRPPTKAQALFWQEGALGLMPKGLGDAEPLPHRSLAEGLGREWASRAAALESSLAWQAVGAGAFGCAQLLLSIPEFGAAPMEPGALGCANAQTQRSREPLGAGLDDEEEPFGLFEQARAWKRPAPSALRPDFRSVADQTVHPEDASREVRRQALLAWMVHHAPESAKQARPGLSWPELWVAREALKMAKDQGAVPDPAACVRMLSEGARAGFSIDWKGLPGRLKEWRWRSGQKKLEGWRELVEWAQLKEQAGQSAEPPKTPTRSL
jgi:hypothetical protein